jgi:protein-S-isoprenylcysteine O-methyltransferase Ste14
MRAAIMLLGVCWLIFIAFWMVRAPGAKHALRPLPRGRQWAFVALVAVGIGLIVAKWGGWTGDASATWLNVPFWPFSAARAVAAVVLAYGGLAVCLWARTVLGRNWSALPEIKKNHDLVTSGPYTFVRHPIYTGLLMMFAAIPLLWVTPWTLFVLLMAAVGIQLKLAREEKLLAGEFPDQWPAYRERTKRVLPLLW